MLKWDTYFGSSQPQTERAETAESAAVQKKTNMSIMLIPCDSFVDSRGNR